MPKRLGQGIGNDSLITNNLYHIYTRTMLGIVPFVERQYLNLIIQLLHHYKTFNTSYSTHQKKIKVYSDSDLKLLDNPRGLLKNSIPVKLHGYCIMPNHIHLVLEQLIDGGIAYYVSRLLNSFTKIYNQDIDRKGTIWESCFKSRVVISDEIFLQLLRYIHLNPVMSSKLKIIDPEQYIYSSYLDAIGNRDGSLCDHSLLHSLMKADQYKEFVESKIKDNILLDEKMLLEDLES